VQSFRVAIIGHVVVEPQTLVLSSKRAAALNQISVNNFLKVVEPNGTMTEDLAYLAKTWKDGKERLSVWDLYLTSGLLLSSHLRRAGANVHLINVVEPETERELMPALAAFDPQVVVMSTTFILSRSHFIRAAAKIRAAAPGAFVVAGGQHIYTSLLYMNEAERVEYLTAAGIDAFINDSQGEGGLLALCEALAAGAPLDDVKNLIWRNPAGVVSHNSLKPELNDINSTLIDFQDANQGSVVHMRTARSCSFKCAFCSYPTIAGSLALMDLDNVRLTLEHARAKGVSSLVFSDDTFNVPEERFSKILDLMIDIEWDIPWYSFLRCQYLDESLVRKMKATNCDGVFLGIESGSDPILKNMKKGAIINFYRDGIRWLKENDITTIGAFVVGFPGETEKTVDLTRSFIENSGIDYYFLQPFFYLHHAPIHKRADHFGLKGDGLFWSHKTMNWKTAVAHVYRLFVDIKNSTFINPDNNMWEYIYLRSKGMTRDEFRHYRNTINALINTQMSEYQLIKSDRSSDPSRGVTSRDAEGVREKHHLRANFN
jgi:anaerobic magnesium-protoporphyrin IX monomethyl ester cyclase